MANQFMFYRNFYENVPEELRKEYCFALARFVFDGELPEDPILRMMVKLVEPSLCNKGGAPIGNKNAAKKETTDETTSETTYKNNPENNVEKQPLLKTKTETKTETKTKTIIPPLSPQGDGRDKAKRFVKPSVEDVKAYCEERRNGINAEDFVNFYESKGWVVGKSPMKDWKAAVRTWETKRGGSGGAAVPTQEEPTKPDNSKYYDATGKFDWRAKCRDMGVDV